MCLSIAAIYGPMNAVQGSWMLSIRPSSQMSGTLSDHFSNLPISVEVFSDGSNILC